MQAVARLQLCAGQVDGGDPAVLVVDRAHQHRDVAAVRAPVDRRAAAVAVGLDAHRAVAFQRLLAGGLAQVGKRIVGDAGQRVVLELTHRSEEHTSELQSLMRISYAVFCLKKKTQQTKDSIRESTT